VHHLSISIIFDPQLWWLPRIEDDADGQVVHQAPAAQMDTEVSDAKSWEEIGAEFRVTLYDLLHRFRQEIKRK
jgi:hypothetical protein